MANPLFAARPRLVEELPFAPREHAELFPQLGDTVYADWTGAAMAPVRLIREHAEFLSRQHLGNPHSSHASSSRAQGFVNEAREAVLSYFEADPAEYDVIFTGNASQAITLLQHYAFERGELLLTADNHNSVNGLREVARRGGATWRYSPLNDDLSLDEQILRQHLARPASAGNRLFGFPAKSNYSGTEHSLDWIEVAHAHGWDVLVDAAAFCANDRISLSRFKPEFVPISFYKMFGYPTGLGCLLVKHAAMPRLQKRWFAGGTILLVSVDSDFYAAEPFGPARFEDGTVNFQNIPAVTSGLRWLSGIAGRKKNAVRVATTLYDHMAALGSVGGNSVTIHSPRGADIVTFSVFRRGQWVDAWKVEQAADKQGIQFRSGCFCNPGSNEKALGYKVDEFRSAYETRKHDEDFPLVAIKNHVGDRPHGAVRASFGYANTVEDANRIGAWMEGYLTTL